MIVIQKHHMGGFLVFLLLFLIGTFVWAGPNWECETEVSGVVCDIIYKTDNNPSAIVIGEIDCNDESLKTVYGIPFYHLEKRHNIDLYEFMDEGRGISILAHECPMASEEGQLKACEIEGIVLYPPNLETKKGKKRQ